ncbi:S8 family peptidase [Aquimarina sp. MMG016]|uniref:S8 family peptidase n=1 Tax=Aquimarina sp. MMG016 TaxID=2822690 RepID=UPI001B3A0630|nr:S8 family peptidase [Aquimarina sp. MMG016]MBQ4819805.1 S8 family serine peptidase [Aquimarina sp. MMG016]
MKKYILIILSIFCFSLIKAQVTQNVSKTVLVKNEELSEEDLKTWYHKDYQEDAIPGISLDKAYKELLTDKKGKEIIVAVIDTKLDIAHEDLKDRIWVNKKEIPDNGIDDDKNGYVDDVNGWDFLGNPEGEYVKYQNLESMRVIRKYDSLFKDVSEKDLSSDNVDEYKLYRKAKTAYKKSIEREVNFGKRVNNWMVNHPKAVKTLKSFFPKEDYKKSQLDSLLVIYKKDSLISRDIEQMKFFLKYNLTQKKIKEYKKDSEESLAKMLNMDFQERKIIGDNPDDISDAFYGYHQVFGDVPFPHSTGVSGVLAATRANGLGIKGISDNIKIMPVVMVATGDEHDKDVALAIRYAVNNGAKVINMSWGKSFSLHEDWVLDAIQYAADKDVLLVTAGGNSGENIDTHKYYPNDHQGGVEIVNNFIVVGASGHTLDKNLKASFSNYGKNDVDIFAPGNEMYTTNVDNKYIFSRGTSIASPIVSGVAALIRSYYPMLSAAQVKEIILKSGASFNVEVEINSEDGESKKLVPFSELSKSGKILNAYNALLLAEKLSKGK